MKTKFYKDKAGKWRWRITSINGNIIGASTQGYVQKKSAEYNLNTLLTVKCE